MHLREIRFAREAVRAPHRLYFIGVTTRQSLIHRVFPLWRDALNLEIELTGVDLPLAAPDDDYRRALTMIREDREAAGALVTTHKIRILNAGRDLFADLDLYARQLGEVAAIQRRPDGSLTGSAKDPITSILALRQIVPDVHWNQSKSHVCCLGAGGSGVAFTTGLLELLPLGLRPERIILVARNDRRFREIREALAGAVENGAVDLLTAAACDEVDRIVAELPVGSLVANATGMGKDVPGSPLSEQAVFPERGIAWDFNYRGDLTFLTQARRQAKAKRLIVEDGWNYFLHGWIHVMADVFGFEATEEQTRTLSAIAAPLRP